MMTCQIRKLFSWLLLLGTIILAVLIGLGLFHPPVALAAIRQMEEAPGQVIYQSRQTLKDQYGNSWQTIAFKRIRPNGDSNFELRLVGFPGILEIDRTQPLTLTDSLGKTLTAADSSSQIFTAGQPPQPNVGQYDLQPLQSELQIEIPLRLAIPTTQGTAIRLSVAPTILQEWQTIAHAGP